MQMTTWEPGVRNGGRGWADLLVVLATPARKIAAAGALTAVAAAFVAFLILPKTYTGRSVLLPPQQSQSVLPAALGQLGALAGFSRDLGMKSQADLYAALLESATIRSEVVQRFDLVARYGARNVEDARKKLGKRTTISVQSKEGLIVVEARDSDPARAADLANAYVDALNSLNGRLAISEAAQRRRFFEQEMRAAKESLSQAEIDMKSMQEGTGALQIDSQVKSIIQAVASLKAEIAAKEVQLRAMSMSATDVNPAVVVAREELAGLRAQLARIQSQGGGVGDPQIATRKLPEVGLNYLRRVRELSFQEMLFELLVKQYEAARIDEAKSAPVIQVIDRATPPVEPSGPPRLLILLGATLAIQLLAVFFVISRDSYQRYVRTPENRAAVDAIRAALRNGRRPRYES